MKILIVNKFLYPNGGSETYIFEIGKMLVSMGHDVQYFGMEDDRNAVGNDSGIYTRNMDFHGGKLSKLTYLFRILYSRDAYKKMMHILDVFKPDVVHFNNINFQLTPSVIEAVADYDIAHMTRTRTVYTAHDSQWVCPGHLMYVSKEHRRCFDCEGGRFRNCVRNRCIHGSRLRSILGAVEGYLYRRKKTYELIDSIICPSKFMKISLETNPLLKGKCVVMHNFIPEKAASRDSELQKRYVLYFGRFSEEKGIRTLLEACRRLPDVRFVFAGSGPLESDVESLDNVDNVGFKSGIDLADLISGASFSVFTSECHENCSFTVMESISYGTPIIASDTGGTPELVSDGINGILFEAGNADELTSSIKRLWNDPEMCISLREGCMNTHYPTTYEYCSEMLSGVYLLNRKTQNE